MPGVRLNVTKGPVKKLRKMTSVRAFNQVRRTAKTLLIMAESSIEWTEMTWNPTTGCTKLKSGMHIVPRVIRFSLNPSEGIVRSLPDNNI